MIAILHKQLRLPGTLHRTLQVLSVHPFEKVTLNELLTETDHRAYIDPIPNRSKLFSCIRTLAKQGIFRVGIRQLGKIVANRAPTGVIYRLVLKLKYPNNIWRPK